ncbi:MAG TPA: energy-coupling factor transporter transmembrane protein EcfT [Clostridiaceae bacterium]|mgnify:CR=1 FL=1|nr:energy-coupling factor transporter transmembrane protein EcfT [Clostridiaceae bacterium]
MIGNITLGQYIPGNSILHRLDPRTKILWTMILMVVTFLIDSWLEYVMMGSLVLLLIIVSGIPVRQTLKGLKPLLFILAFTAILNIFLTGGTPLVTIGPVRITYEGVMSAVKLFLRLVMLVITASLMTLTTTPMTMTDGIERLLRPLGKIGVPSHEIAMMMSIALRFIPTLMEETERIMKAQASRGADFDTGSIFSRIKSFIPVLVPLFVSAFKRADELAEAMESRCYHGGKGRTRLRTIHFTYLDGTVTIAGLLYLALLFGIRLIR